MNGGLTGLILALLVGKRSGYPKVAMKPFSIILAALGAGFVSVGGH